MNTHPSMRNFEDLTLGCRVADQLGDALRDAERHDSAVHHNRALTRITLTGLQTIANQNGWAAYYAALSGWTDFTYQLHTPENGSTEPRDITPGDASFTPTCITFLAIQSALYGYKSWYPGIQTTGPYREGVEAVNHWIEQQDPARALHTLGVLTNYPHPYRNEILGQ
jgi:hypothetical protein